MRPTIDHAPATSFLAESIRNGWVSGWARFLHGTTLETSAPRWNPRTGEVDSNPSGVLDGGTAVNRYGWRVGRETLNRPVLNYDGGRLSLPDLGHPGQPGNRAVTVSDDGRTIAGQVSTGNGAELAAVVWRCQ